MRCTPEYSFSILTPPLKILGPKIFDADQLNDEALEMIMHPTR